MPLFVGFAKIPLWHESYGPLELGGYSGREGRPFIGVLDVPEVRALFLEEKEVRIVIVGCELTALDSSYCTQIRKEIENGSVAPRGTKSIIACTHTHASPATFSWKFHAPDAAYMEQVSTTIKLAVLQASEAKREIVCIRRFSAPMEGNFVMNRTFVDGAGYMHKKFSAEIPGSMFFPPHVDPDITALEFVYSPDESVSIINLACHPTAMERDNMMLSRDFPGTLLDCFARLRGHGRAHALFLNGAAGDVRPALRRPSTPHSMASMGTALGAQAWSMMERHPECT